MYWAVDMTVVDNDSQHSEAFGHQHLGWCCRRNVNRIKNNDPSYKTFYINRDEECDSYVSDGSVDSDDAPQFSDLAWELLGGYIAENDHLEEIHLEKIRLTDAKVSILFKKMTRSRSLKEFDLAKNNFGPTGFRSMVPFLKNSPNLTTLRFEGNDNIDTECFGSMINALHGGPIQCLLLKDCNIEDIAALEEHTLPHLRRLDLQNNIIQTIPSLENCANLEFLNLNDNNIQAIPLFQKCANLEQLYVAHNSLDDIAALEECTLPRLNILSLAYNNIQSVPLLENLGKLETLWLGENKIGKEGCRSLVKMLRNENSSLQELDLSSNSIDDEGAELLANSLKRNTKLKDLDLEENKFQEKGCLAFLKLLNDVSSIERTYTSNHTLTRLQLPHIQGLVRQIDINGRIDSAVEFNEQHAENPEGAGRSKVIQTQLNARTRQDLCQVEGVDSSYASLFAEINPLLLPNILALVVGNDWQDDVYQILVATAPALTSLMDRRAMLNEAIRKHETMIAEREVMIAKHEAMLAALTAETSALNSKKCELERRLDSIDSGGGSQSTTWENDSSRKSRGKKRRRSASF